MAKVESSMKEKARDWLDLANRDLHISVVSIKEEIYNIACFHAQQAVEKTIKAYIINKSELIPKTHDLNNLVHKDEELSKILADFDEELDFLDALYITTRYPDVIVGSLEEGLPDKSDAEYAVNSAKEIIKQTTKNII